MASQTQLEMFPAIDHTRTVFGSVSGTASSLAMLAIVSCLDGAADDCGVVAIATDFRLSLRMLVNRFIV